MPCVMGYKGGGRDEGVAEREGKGRGRVRREGKRWKEIQWHNWYSPCTW